MNRRRFLQRMEALSAGAVAVGLGLPLSGCIGFHYVNSSLAGDRLLIRRDEIGDSRFVLADAPGHQLPIFVHRSDAGEWTAVSTRCMHRGCQVGPGADRLECPCHGSEYTFAGQVLKGPTQRPLRAFPVTVEEDVIAIELPPGGDQW